MSNATIKEEVDESDVFCISLLSISSFISVNSYFIVLHAFISFCNQLVSADGTLLLLDDGCETGINAFIGKNKTALLM